MLILLKQEASASQDAIEQLCPILQVLGGGALIHRNLRKYLRSKVLPPLREVHKRPEEVNTLRGALCRLLTCPTSPVRDLAADLLFVLCKESGEYCNIIFGVLVIYIQKYFC
jgi:hypothetical protein